MTHQVADGISVAAETVDPNRSFGDARAIPIFKALQAIKAQSGDSARSTESEGSDPSSSSPAPAT